MKEIELKGLRKRREKHFLQENGDIVAQVYNEDIHYLEDGKYKEIDNTIVRENNYYKNKENSYQAYFNDYGSHDFLKLISKDYFLNIILKDYNNVLPVTKDNCIRYENIKEGIDFEYILLPTKVKENIIIHTKEAIQEKICFDIQTNLMLEIVNNSIQALKENEVIFTIENPFMIDANENKNDSLYYHLLKTKGGYELELILDLKWLETAAYPVIIDPTISTNSENKDVYDTYIYPKDTNIDRNNQDILKVGVEKVAGQDIVNRALLKFDLPTIGTGSQVIAATLNLIGYGEILPKQSEIINVHEVTSNWSEATATWDTMHNQYNERIEASFENHRSILIPKEDGSYALRPVSNECDITNLVKKWYADKPNYGIMLKANKEVYKGEEVPAFYSKNNHVENGNPKAYLMIRYRNQNGLENYMHYENQGFTEGTTYFNTYNGNLTGVFHLGETIGGKFPASLSLIYNTNDVILKKDVGVGLGNQLNFNQTIEEVLIGQTSYLEYVDGDGTIHYFMEEQDENGTILCYKDEDGLNLTIEKSDTEYVLTDKENNKMKFIIENQVGYLKEIIDVSDYKNTIYYDSNHRVIKVVDANEAEIGITYETNKVTVVSPNETVILNYSNNRLTSIHSKMGITSFSYYNQNIIESITDTNGRKIKYEYYSQVPYRIKKISQYGLKDTLGQYFSVTYGFNSTTLLDYKGRSTILTYNNLGNLISTSNLKNLGDLKSAYGVVQKYGGEEYLDEVGSHKNKLLSSGIPIKYVKNYLSNSSFEEEELGFVTNCYEEEFRIMRSSDTSFSGKYSLKTVSLHPTHGGECHRTVSVPKGKYYTLSIYASGSEDFSMSVSYQTVEDSIVVSETIKSSEDEFSRQYLTFYYPEEATSNLTISFLFLNQGIYYMDDIQLEEGEVANKYNMLENSDFSNNLESWDIGATDYEELTSDGSFLDVTEEVFSIVSINDLGDKALRVKMNPSQGSYFSKTYEVNGKKGETYCINFWYKDEGFYASGIVGDPLRNNVTISYDYLTEDNEMGHGTINSPTFNPNDTDWQYYSTSFVAERDFKSLTLYFDQEHNANYFYVTNLYLFKDLRENYFDYDESGNLKEVYGLDQEKSKYNYDMNNQLVRMVNPKGDRFTYEYDNKITDRVIGGISESGLSNTIQYDSFGNPIITRVQNIGSSIVDGKCYQIRAKGTNQYIRCIHKSLVLNSDDCGHDKWLLEKVDDNYYRFKYPILENQYLAKAANTLALIKGVENASQFRLLKRNNNSYYMELKGDELKPVISKEEIEDKLNTSMQEEMNVADFLYSFVSEGFVIASTMDKHIKQAKEEDILSDSIMLMALSQIIAEKPLFKEDLIEVLYWTLNEEENPLYARYNENKIELSTLLEDDTSFEFYFEDTEFKLFLESSSTYTEDGKFITSTTDTNFHVTTYDIDTNTGLVNSITDAKGNKTSTTYDEKERPVTITRGEKQIEYSYNEQNQLDSIREDNKEYHFTYDDFGNRKEVKIGDTTLVTNTYEENDGNLKKITYGNGDEINYTYDEFDRVKTLIKEDNTYHYKYDSNGSLTKIKSDRDTTLYNYDLSKRLNEFCYNDLKTKYTYDKNNNVESKTCYLNQFTSELTNTYNEDNIVTKTTFDNNDINYNYDELGRLINRNINNQIQTNYEYVSHGNRTSLLVKSVENNGDKYSYRYDEIGNIKEIYHNGILEKKYYYDDYNELLEEKDYKTNQKISYLYDNSGNLLTKKYYNLTNETLLSKEEYQYQNPNWKDQLTCYNNTVITYDEIGNPITIGNNTLEWINGRQLKSYNQNQYQYNVNGIRTSKTVNNVETKYYIEGTKIIFEQKGNNVIYYIRNSIEGLIGFYYNQEKYYYIKNNLEDITGILDSNYNLVASYTYDSWGNIISIRDSNGLDISTNETHIANINPYRYRSYYYDIETNLYYLNSRYYNPQWGRFLNADGIIGSSSSILGNNLYNYCYNHPIGKKDLNGFAAMDLASILISGAEKTVETVAPAIIKKEEKKYHSYTPSPFHTYNDKTSCKVSTKKPIYSESPYYCDETSNSKVTSIISQSSGFSPKITLKIGGVAILDAGYSNQVVSRFENGIPHCYHLEKVGFTKYIGVQKYKMTPIDCNSAGIVPIGDTIPRTEFQFFSARWTKEDGLYSDFTESASFLGTEVSAGYIIEY